MRNYATTSSAEADPSTVVALTERGLPSEDQEGLLRGHTRGLAALLDTDAFAPVGCCHSPEYSASYVGGIELAASPKTELKAVIG